MSARKATPGWLKSFATRKKPRLDDKPNAAPAAAGKTVDVSTVDDYMAAELLEARTACRERHLESGVALCQLQHR
jgi:hypothetical protein